MLLYPFGVLAGAPDIVSSGYLSWRALSYDISQGNIDDERFIGKCFCSQRCVAVLSVLQLRFLGGNAPAGVLLLDIGVSLAFLDSKQKTASVSGGAFYALL